MEINEILQLTNTINNAKADSKKSVLELISKTIAQNLLDIEYEQIFDCLLAREKISSTGIGHGVSIPHCVMANISKPIGAFIHLQKPVDFAAIDNNSVDLFFALLIPEKTSDKYLDILAALAEKLRKKDVRKKLRAAKDAKELYQIITGSES